MVNMKTVICAPSTLTLRENWILLYTKCEGVIKPNVYLLKQESGSLKSKERKPLFVEFQIEGTRCVIFEGSKEWLYWFFEKSPGTHSLQNIRPLSPYQFIRASSPCTVCWDDEWNHRPIRTATTSPCHGPPSFYNDIGDCHGYGVHHVFLAYSSWLEIHSTWASECL